MTPRYLKLFESKELQERVDRAHEVMRCCTICPQNCKVDRIGGSLGVCGVGELAPVSSYAPHFGEERPLVGKNGSGTIFFASCNLLCIFCQNYEISHFDEAYSRHLTNEELAAVMINLQQQGCHNINLVTPTHVVPQILAALPIAIKHGLKVPLVYNSSGYDSPATLELLDGIVDIYMPDFKFWNTTTARTYTKAPNYPNIARTAIKAMHRQVGDLIVDENGIATRGLLIRHLVMPGQLDETEEIINYIANEISPQCHINIMDQYRPCGKAVSPIDRTLQAKEYQRVLEYADRTNLIQLNEGKLADVLKHLGLL